MGLSAAVLAFWNALAGVGLQTAAQAYISFMLGYAPGRAGATASVMALVASVAAVLGWFMMGTEHLRLLPAVLVSVGAITGVLLASAIPLKSAVVRRSGKGLVVLLCVFVISEGVRTRFTGLPQLAWDWLGTSYGHLIVGSVAGLAGQLIGLPVGVFLVPAFSFALGLSPAQAVVSSLLVVALAGVLPVWGVLRAAMADAFIGPTMYVSGAVGSFTGGWLLATLGRGEATWPLAVFGVTAMILSAWLAYKET